MPSIWGDSITLRSFAPLPWRTWMTPRALSMSSIRLLAERMWVLEPTPSDRSIEMADLSPLRRRMIEDMTVRNLSPATQRSYISAVSKFSRYFGRSPDRLELEDVRAFQVHLVSTGISWPALNQIVCALRFFYGVTLGEALIPERIPYAIYATLPLTPRQRLRSIPIQKPDCRQIRSRQNAVSRFQINSLGFLHGRLFSPSRRRMRLTLAGEIPTSAAICLPVWRCRRKASTAAPVAGWVWLGNERGLEERSRNPLTPSAPKRLTHLATVFAETLNFSAAAAWSGHLR